MALNWLLGVPCWALDIARRLDRRGVGGGEFPIANKEYPISKERRVRALIGYWEFLVGCWILLGAWAGVASEAEAENFQ